MTENNRRALVKIIGSGGSDPETAAAYIAEVDGVESRLMVWDEPADTNLEVPS